MVELEQMTPGGKRLLKKASARGLNATVPLGGRPKASASLGRSKSLSCPSLPPKSTKSSPSRGLTLRIEDHMTSYSQLIQSAPVKALRRLPAVPIPVPAAAGGISQLEPTTPLSAPAELDPQTPPRLIRPLPCPPPLANKAPSTPPRNESPGSCPPTERPRVRVVKPLPVPVLKVEPLVLNRKSLSAASHSPIQSTLKTPSLPTLTPTSSPSTHQKFRKKENEDKKTSPQDLHKDFSDEEEEESILIQLNDRILLRNRATLSLDSDDTSDDDDSDSEPTFRQTHVVLGDAKNENKGRDDGVPLVDYTWMLSNRILYRQDGPQGCDPQFGGKWMREKKGKRYTEQDYENVLRVLRTL